MNSSVSHFTLFECLHDDDYTAIYKAENNLTNQKVLLKVLNKKGAHCLLSLFQHQKQYHQD